MSARLVRLIGPIAIGLLLAGVSLTLTRLFELGRGPARGFSPELVAWLSLGATLAVVVAWLVGVWLASENGR